jgi:Holliday junction resolvasome RuvABC endonuclease subunit
MSHGTHASLIDDLSDAYTEWRAESAAVESAYGRWSIAASADAAYAFAAYMAALDREEFAAAEYALLHARGRAPWSRERRHRAWLSEAA